MLYNFNVHVGLVCTVIHLFPICLWHKVIHYPTTTLQNTCERNVIFLDVMSSVCKMVNQCFRRQYHLQAAVSLEMMVTTYILQSCPIPENYSLILTSVDTQILWERTFHFVQTKIQKRYVYRCETATYCLLWEQRIWKIKSGKWYMEVI